MRIRRRLVLLAIGVATAGMALFAVLLSGLLARGVSDDRDAALAQLATETAGIIATLAPSALAARTPLAPIDLATSVDPFIVVVDADGASLYATGTLDGAPLRIPAAVIVEASETGISDATVRPAPDQEFRLFAVRWSRDGSTGVAVAGQSTRFVDQQIAGVRFFLIFAAVVAIVAVALATWLVVGRALRPLRTLTATADEIATTGDLSRRLPPVRTRDEVGVLTTSFNGMLDRVSAAQDQLAASLAAQRRFVADASHELRTPLTTIRNNAGFLLEHPAASPTDRSEAITDIAAESERLSRLVDDLLRLARADAGGRFERHPVDLARIVADVARKARTTARAVTSQVPDGPVVVDGDADALTRLAWILVENALTHGAGNVEVSVTVDGIAAMTKLSVSDHGPGIPTGQEQRIFERFHRADPARSGGGAGLGLAIALSIAVAHGGGISAANRDGGGSTFVVELPLFVA
jgi:two-component system, OmpR family, sensor kinase